MAGGRTSSDKKKTTAEAAATRTALLSRTAAHYHDETDDETGGSSGSISGDNNKPPSSSCKNTRCLIARATDAAFEEIKAKTSLERLLRDLVFMVPPPAEEEEEEGSSNRRSGNGGAEEEESLFTRNEDMTMVPNRITCSCTRETPTSTSKEDGSSYQDQRRRLAYRLGELHAAATYLQAIAKRVNQCPHEELSSVNRNSVEDEEEVGAADIEEEQDGPSRSANSTAVRRMIVFNYDQLNKLQKVSML